MPGHGRARRVAFTIMLKICRPAAPVVAALLLGGCSFAEEGLWPSLTGEEPSGAAQAPAAESIEIAPSPAEASGQPLVAPSQTRMAAAGPATSQAVPLSMPAGTAVPNTGTFVGQKVVSLSSELETLKGQIAAQSGEYQSVGNSAAQGSQRYHALVGDINARLQAGTTPGNPVMVSQWQSAQQELDTVSSDSSKLTELSNRIAANSDMINYLFESTRAAYSIQGAVEEDHRQLAILEDDLDRVRVSNDRLLNEINATISRHNSYLFGERRNLTALALAISSGRAYGPSLAGMASPLPPSQPMAGAATGPALVVIRFDRPDVEYEQALYEAVTAALDRRSDARFELVAVTAMSGSPSEVAANSGEAKRNAERVMRSLMNMGLPADRVTMASTASDAVRTNEVQLYVR